LWVVIDFFRWQNGLKLNDLYLNLFVDFSNFCIGYYFIHKAEVTGTNSEKFANIQKYNPLNTFFIFGPITDILLFLLLAFFHKLTENEIIMFISDMFALLIWGFVMCEEKRKKERKVTKLAEVIA